MLKIVPLDCVVKTTVQPSSGVGHHTVISGSRTKPGKHGYCPVGRKRDTEGASLLCHWVKSQPLEKVTLTGKPSVTSLGLSIKAIASITGKAGLITIPIFELRNQERYNLPEFIMTKPEFLFFFLIQKSMHFQLSYPATFF